jgi:hypothetical protein
VGCAQHVNTPAAPHPHSQVPNYLEYPLQAPSVQKTTVVYNPYPLTEAGREPQWVQNVAVSARLQAALGYSWVRVPARMCGAPPVGCEIRGEVGAKLARLLTRNRADVLTDVKLLEAEWWSVGFEQQLTMDHWVSVSGSHFRPAQPAGRAHSYARQRVEQINGTPYSAPTHPDTPWLQTPRGQASDAHLRQWRQQQGVDSDVEA